jgi:glycerol-3-phosphate acyltransferase PlsX
MRIVLDAMGSDNHPLPEVLAAVKAAQDFDIEVILVGNEEVVQPLLEKHNPNHANVTFVHAPDTFKMTDKITAGKLRRLQTSMSVGMTLVKEGQADAFVSAGNTGGVMANALAQFRRIKGVKRPGLSAIVPTKDGTVTVMDIGANTEVTPIMLAQFATMASLYTEKALGKANPRVSFLANGEEDVKGNALIKESFPLFKQIGLNFIGNAEPKEIYLKNKTDVVITDGFTGNIFIKTSEAIAKLLTDMIKEGVKSNLITTLGGLLLMPVLNKLKKKLNPGEIGAAPLLGVDGLTFVAHGSSDDFALYNSILRAKEAVDADLLNALRSQITQELEIIKELIQEEAQEGEADA